MKKFCGDNYLNTHPFLWMKLHKNRIILSLFLYPNIVCFSPDSTGTSNTFVDLLLGMGKYANVTYNCEGQVTDVDRYSFYDYGAAVSHNIDELNFGLRAGGYSITGSESENNYFPGYEDNLGNSAQYINPFIGFDHKYFEMNVGLLILTDYPVNENINRYFFAEGSTQFTGVMRIGNEQAFHFSTQYLSSVPLLSGGGMYDIGLGFGNEKNRNTTWVGLSAGPFQNGGLTLKQNVQLSDEIDLLIKGRIGQIESNFEGSLSAGLRYNF